MRVLVVDDSEDICDLVGMLIRVAGPEWELAGTASNGLLAVEAARDVQPDVVLLDSAMPVMDGLEALPLIRQAVPGAAIIMVSAFPATTLREAALAAGAVGYLEKRSINRTLLPSVERILQEAGNPVPRQPSARDREEAPPAVAPAPTDAALPEPPSP